MFIRKTGKILFQQHRGLVTLSRVHDGQSALIKIDDGKVNSFSFEMLSEIDRALTSVDVQESNNIIFVGNEKAFSAGFDLKIMQGADRNRAADLVKEGAKIGIRLLESQKPIVAVCSGHAVAMGAIKLLCSDYRIGWNRPNVKVGLNEVSINMDLPIMVLALAQMKMSPSALDLNLAFGRILSPREATGSNGYLDEVVDATSYDDFVDKAVEKTKEWIKGIHQPAFGQIKANLRKEKLEFIKNTLDSDINKYRP